MISSTSKRSTSRLTSSLIRQWTNTKMVGGKEPLEYIGQRRNFMYGRLYKLAKKMTPRMSNTEKAALESGTVGFDRHIFEGNPSLSDLSKYKITLSHEEKSFLDNEVNELCEMVNDYEITQSQDLPLKAWQYIKEKGFLGMIIPKEYGGKQFSAHAHSQVITKLSSRSTALGVTVCVPNSLGPAELLLRYGTKEQKNNYLPKLASGSIIPCFGLTGPSSGSDAANMRDIGIICKNDKGELGIKATFNKRYITLAPVATCVGLAIDVKDPDNYLKESRSVHSNEYPKEGITVCLLDRNHPGLKMGKRHNPLNTGFMNGTVNGENVFIPFTSIIGGKDRIGFGWNMLMDCLAEGRSISLPAGAVAGAKVSLNACGAYAKIRKQFKVPISTMEGVHEHLALIGLNTFIMTSGQYLVNSMLNQHEQPAVISGVTKQQITKRGRSVIVEAMDVLGGMGICDGKSNFMAGKYMATPVAITVEGANTLTRSLIIYGQGLTRAHPHLYNLIKSIQKTDDIKGFKENLHLLLNHGFVNAGRSFTRSVYPSFLLNNNNIDNYEKKIKRLASNFAILSDFSLLLGGKLKFNEMLSGRYADLFSNIYLAFATMWFYDKHKNIKGIDVFLNYSMKYLLYESQETIYNINNNFPIKSLSYIMKLLTFPLGKVYSLPTDHETREIADLISSQSEIRDFLSQYIFISNNNNDKIKMLNDLLPKAIETDILLKRIKKEKRKPTNDEIKLIDLTEKLRDEVIQVDSFDRLGMEINAGKDYIRPAFINKK